MSDHDDEVVFLARMRRRAAAATRPYREEDPEDDDADVGYEKSNPVIVAPAESDYYLPGHFAKTVPPDALAELRRLLGRLAEFREQIVGLRETEVQVLYNGNPVALDLGHEFERWILSHLERRLARLYTRTNDSAVRRWLRLSDDFMAWFDQLGLYPPWGHWIVLHEVVDRLHWEVFDATYDGDPRFEKWASDSVRRNRWDALGGVERCMKRFPSLATGVEGSAERLDAELKEITGDLVEMTSILARHYRPEDHVVRVGEQTFATWIWTFRHSAGLVFLGPTEEVAAAGGATFTGGASAVSIALDGRPFDSGFPWIRLDDDVLPWTVGLLRPLHAALVDLWARTERLWDGTLPRDALADGETVAAACEALAAGDAATEAVDGPAQRHRRPQNRVPAVRSLTLLGLLERQFGCEVRRGKGSEITVWRPGGRKYTLPGHERNTHMPSHIVRAMLKAVGIPAAEFASVARKRR